MAQSRANPPSGLLVQTGAVEMSGPKVVTKPCHGRGRPMFCGERIQMRLRHPRHSREVFGAVSPAQGVGPNMCDVSNTMLHQKPSAPHQCTNVKVVILAQSKLSVVAKISLIQKSATNQRLEKPQLPP